MKIHKIRFSAVESSRDFSGSARFRYDNICKLIKNKLVLDVGCGLTPGSYLLAQKGAKKVIAIDYSQQVINKATSRYQLPNLEFLCLNVLDLARFKQTFDYVVAFEIIEHLPTRDQAKFLKNIKKVLKPTGSLLLTTPNRLIVSKGLKHPRSPFHTREFSPKELAKLVHNCGYKSQLYGLNCTNTDFLKTQQKVTSKKSYKLITYIEKYKFIHYLLPLIPKKLKNVITGFDKIPSTKPTDFKWVQKNIEKSPELFIIGQNQPAEPGI